MRETGFATDYSNYLSEEERPQWDLADCDRKLAPGLRAGHVVTSTGVSSKPVRVYGGVYPENWAELVPDLISKLSSEVTGKIRLEVNFAIFKVLLNDLKADLKALRAAKTLMVSINTFAPEPYNLLKPIIISVQVTEHEYEAGWFDANIHSSGENEDDAVSNLKNAILDFYDSYLKEAPEALGIEPTRQLAVLKEFIERKK